ncbi:expressed unknown protein [Seminavis robusta]|uniref:Uncharacterized protein n=1 Tax=Seminavis robusta TaxID=568900 RepID=A0A9N8DKL9_9STRA|nr:expressed unknown protein [Seminavis robusta]|eukprot:Sro137_g064330.1 n/a (199) ;mRNA; f:31892-32488
MEGSSSSPLGGTPVSTQRVVIGGSHGHVEEAIDGHLLVLWSASLCNWKPLRNCTGRYSCREKRTREELSTRGNVLFPSQMDPIMLMQYALSCANSDSKEKNLATEWQLQVFAPAPGRTDRILVLPLDAQQQTGIITYVKQQKQPQQQTIDEPTISKDVEREMTSETTAVEHDGCRYVHTLNAPSGFQRKLKAVGIQLG